MEHQETALQRLERLGYCHVCVMYLILEKWFVLCRSVPQWSELFCCWNRVVIDTWPVVIIKYNFMET